MIREGWAIQMEAKQQYRRRFWAGMVLYALLLITARLVLRGAEDAWWRFPVAVAPVLPVVLVVLAVVERLRTLDELQQRIQLEALGFAFAMTAVLTFAYGFLQTVGFPTVSWMWVLPVMSALWGVGLLLAGQRYH